MTAVQSKLSSGPNETLPLLFELSPADIADTDSEESDLILAALRPPDLRLVC